MLGKEGEGAGKGDPTCKGGGTGEEVGGASRIGGSENDDDPTPGNEADEYVGESLADPGCAG